MVTKRISSYTKEVGGHQVPTWDIEEIDELVTSQVHKNFIT